MESFYPRKQSRKDTRKREKSPPIDLCRFGKRRRPSLPWSPPSSSSSSASLLLLSLGLRRKEGAPERERERPQPTTASTLPPPPPRPRRRRRLSVPGIKKERERGKGVNFSSVSNVVRKRWLVVFCDDQRKAQITESALQRGASSYPR